MLEGEFIRLRAIEPEDINLLLLWENDTENWNVSETLAPFSRFLLEEYLKQSQDIYIHKQIRFIIEEKVSKNPVGLLDFFDFNPKNKRAGLGILIDKNQRNKGYALDALQVAKVYAEHLSLHQLHCSVGADNLKSISLFEKAGFCEMGIKRDWRYFGGTWKDEIDYQYILEN